MRNALLLLVSLSVFARPRGHFRVVPAVYDPDRTGAVISRWVPFSGPGSSDPAIIMSKILPTSAEAAAIANVQGVEGITLDELGFDVFDGGHCDAGAPRFDVMTTDGYVYFFGCAYGAHAPSPDNPATFTRVRFAEGDAVPQLVGNPPFHFGTRIAQIAIVFDEGIDQGSGFTAIDDIDINGVIVERGSGGDDDHGRETAERPHRRY